PPRALCASSSRHARRAPVANERRAPRRQVFPRRGSGGRRRSFQSKAEGILNLRSDLGDESNAPARAVLAVARAAVEDEDNLDLVGQLTLLSENGGAVPLVAPASSEGIQVGELEEIDVRGEN